MIKKANKSTNRKSKLKVFSKKNKIKNLFSKEKLGLKIGVLVAFLVLLGVFLCTFLFLKNKNVKKDNSFFCSLLDKQYCSLGKPVYNQNKEFIGIGFKLPEGSKIYVPFDNARLDEKKVILVQLGSNFYPAGVLLDTNANNSCETKTFLMAYGSPQLNVNQESFKKGESFAVFDKMIVNKDLGDYNLILAFRGYDTKNNQWKTNVDLLKNYFPNLEVK